MSPGMVGAPASSASASEYSLSKVAGRLQWSASGKTTRVVTSACGWCVETGGGGEGGGGDGGGRGEGGGRV